MRFPFDLVFGIPPVEKRPRKNFFLNHYAVAGYDPHSVESYILYKSFMLAIWIVAGAIFIYYMPIGFGIVPDFWGLRLDRPVEYFKDDFPRRIALPTIAICCVYAVVIAYLNKRRHNWDFSGTRPGYLHSLKRFREGRFSFLQMLALHIAFPAMLLLILNNLHLSLTGLNTYKLIRSFNDFDDQSSRNFVVVAVFYFALIGGVSANIFNFFALLILERLRNPSSKLKPTPKGIEHDGG